MFKYFLSSGTKLINFTFFIPPGTYNAFFPVFRVIGPGREGRITRKGGKNALLLRQGITKNSVTYAAELVSTNA